MKTMRLLSVAALVLAAGCFRVTVNTGAPQAATGIDKEWQLSFVYGLVPPPEVAAQETCPQGVATIMTERSFLNSLVGMLSWSLLTPMHTKVTCASGPVAR